jgi:hypothetical protein
MTAIEQFMAQYFRDRTQLIVSEIERRSPHRSAYFAQDCRWDSRQGTVESSEAEKILNLLQNGEETLVITTGQSHNRITFPLRYHLRPHGESWLIYQVDLQCPGCQGTGKLHGDARGQDCHFCGGKGWK